MSEPPDIQTAAIIEMGSPVSREDVARAGALSRPLAQALLAMPPGDRFNAMGSLLLSFAISFSNPRTAFQAIVAATEASLSTVLEQSGRPEPSS
jgi:hypothetical protein